MKKRTRSAHGPRHVTSAGRSIFYDISSEAETVELEIRSGLPRGLTHWLTSSRMTRIEAARVLGVTQARVSDIKRGKIGQFSLDLLIRLATKAKARSLNGADKECPCTLATSLRPIDMVKGVEDDSGKKRSTGISRWSSTHQTED
jgi:predicted XRE-type DNA-binding protein